MEGVHLCWISDEVPPDVSKMTVEQKKDYDWTIKKKKQEADAGIVHTPVATDTHSHIHLPPLLNITSRPSIPTHPHLIPVHPPHINYQPPPTNSPTPHITSPPSNTPPNPYYLNSGKRSQEKSRDRCQESHSRREKRCQNGRSGRGQIRGGGGAGGDGCYHRQGRRGRKQQKRASWGWGGWWWGWGGWGWGGWWWGWGG